MTEGFKYPYDQQGYDIQDIRPWQHLIEDLNELKKYKICIGQNRKMDWCRLRKEPATEIFTGFSSA